MTFATTIPRYDKNQLLIIDNREISLIDHLKELRSAKKITKKKISNLIKHNDYWYSQIERNGKNGDDQRQRTIYRTDLVDIISIVYYGANSKTELEKCKDKSEVYLDKIIKALPIKNSARKLEWYELYQCRTPEEQDRLFNSLLDTQEKLLRKAYDSLQDSGDKDNFLDALKNTNLSLKIDPLFIVFLSGLPFADFLYESKQHQLFSLLRSVMNLLDEIEIDENGEYNSSHSAPIIAIQNQIIKYTGQSFMQNRNRKYNLVDPADFRD